MVAVFNPQVHDEFVQEVVKAAHRDLKRIIKRPQLNHSDPAPVRWL